MAWYTIPSLIVAILSIIQILVSGRIADVESTKRDLLINLIKSAIISLMIFIVEVITLYFFYSDITYYYNEIFLRYSLYLYFSILTAVFLILLFFPYYRNNTTKIEKNANGYLVQTKSTYSTNTKIKTIYIIKKMKTFLTIKFSTFLIEILLFLSVFIFIIVGLKVLQNGRINDSKYPFVANEKIFITNNKAIEIYEVKNKKIQRGTLPEGTKFSIAKGVSFSFDYEKLNTKYKGGKSNIHNGIYGLSSNKKISLKKGTQLYFEDMVDYTIYVNDENNNLSEYYSVKTIPGKTYILHNSDIQYEVISNPERKTRDTVYSFIVGHTKDDIDFKEFLDNTTLLNSIFMIFVLFIIPFTRRKYLYIVALTGVLFCVIFYSIKTNGLSRISAISVALFFITIIEMIFYQIFLKENLIIARLDSMSKVNIELLCKKPEIIFTKNGTDKLDLKLGRSKRYYTEQLEYTTSENNEEKTTDELRIIVYRSYKDIYLKYFYSYSILNKIFQIIIKNSKRLQKLIVKSSSEG